MGTEILTPKDTKKPVVDVDIQRAGLITTWMNLSLGMAEETVKASFGILQDVRNEAADRMASTLDYFDQLNQGMFRIGRKVNDRVDRVTTRAIDASEKAMLSLFTTLRRTSRGASEFANTTTASLISHEPN